MLIHFIDYNSIDCSRADLFSDAVKLYYSYNIGGINIMLT